MMMLTLALCGVGYAEETPAPEEPTGGTGGDGTDPDGGTGDSDEGSADDYRYTRPDRLGAPSRQGYALGAGGWFLHTPTGLEAFPAVTFQLRRQRAAGGDFAVELVTTVELHDFQTIGEGYAWYARPVREGGEDISVLKYVFLFPLAVMMPLIGSNLDNAVLFNVKLPAGPLVFRLGAGLHGGILVRPSEENFLLDLTVGPVSDIGLDLGEEASLDLWGRWSPPLFHMMIEPDWSASYRFGLTATFWQQPRARRWP